MKLENPYRKCNQSLREAGFKATEKRASLHQGWQEGFESLERWLLEPCTEHSCAIGKQCDDFFMVSDVKYPAHRYLCPVCLEELGK